MINKCFKLLFIQLRGILFSGQFGAKRGQKRIKAAGMVLLAALVAVVFAFYSAFFTWGYIQMGLQDSVLPLIMTASSVVILFTTMFKASSFIFSARDNDLLMSLPVKNWAIIVSRFGSLYIYETAITAILMVPSLAVYAILCGPSVLFVIMAAVSILFVPLIPLAIATLIGIVITFIAARFRYKNLISIVLSCVVFIAIMYYSMSMSSVDETMLAELNILLMDFIGKVYPPASLYANGLAGSLLSYAGYLLVSVAVSGIIIALIARRLNWLIAALTSHKTRGNFKMTALKTGSVFGALLGREFKRYFSSPIYVFNTALLYVLLIIGAIALFFIKDVDAVLNLPGASAMIGAVVPLLISFFAAITSTTSASLSLEGNQLWLLASFPVSSATVFRVKIAMNLILGLPSVLIASILCMIRFRLDLLWGLIAVVIPVLYTLLASVGGMYVNIRFPNFTWTNEAAVVKQSASAMITVFGGMILVVIPGAALLTLGIPALPLYIVTAVVLAALNLFFYMRVIKTPLRRFCSD